MAKTALELTLEEWQGYDPSQSSARVNFEEQAKLKERQQQAWELAHKAARVLREEFGASKVVVFGSLAHRAWFSSQSDIDIAAWGIAPEHFYSAVGSLAEFSPTFNIDLVDPVHCAPALLEKLEGEGIEL